MIRHSVCCRAARECGECDGMGMGRERGLYGLWCCVATAEGFCGELAYSIAWNGCDWDGMIA